MKGLDYLGPEGFQKMSRLPVVKQSAKLTDKSELPSLSVSLLNFPDVPIRVG